MAGDTGFEPVNDGVKVRCLTAWRIPNKMGRLMGIEPTYEGVTVLCLNRLTTAAMKKKISPVSKWRVRRDSNPKPPP